MTSKFFKRDFYQKVAEHSVDPDLVMQVYEDQQMEAILAGDTDAREAFYSGLTKMVRRILKLGQPGLIGAKKFSAKSNAQLYIEKPYLFDSLNQQPFGGAQSMGEAHAWLTDKGMEW